MILGQTIFASADEAEYIPLPGTARKESVTNEAGETEPPSRPAGDPRPPEAWESGVKDTVIAYPGEVTRIRARFSNPGQFVWHCHIVEHEDNEMMRPYRIGPRQHRQPSG